MASDLPNPAAPAHEADCLAWIEGEPLPRDREQALSRVLGEDRVLARKLEAMRADRAAIKAMPQVSAPAGLMAAVEAALQPMLERQMLLGLRDGESVSDHPPISIVQPVKRSIMQAFFADRVGRRLAAAAALLLMVGGATYLGTTYLSGRTAPKPNSALRKDAGKPGAVPETRIAVAPDTKFDAKTGAATEGSAKEGAAPGALSPGERTLAAAPPVPAEADTTAETTIAMVDASEYGTWAIGPFLPDLDGARAASLAREGRLMIRVTAIDPSFRNGGVAERIRRADASMIRLGDEAPPALVQVLAPPAPPPTMGPDPEPYIAPSIAGDTSARPSEPVYHEPARIAYAVPPEQTVYLVQVRLDGAAMDALRGTLSGGYGEAQFEELAEPLQEGTTAINPNSVVWWTQGPAAWNGWAGIPVVVDVNR